MSRTPTRLIFGRIVLYGAALVLNIAVSILLARRLSDVDYAVYQYATKRIITYATIPIGLFGVWMYRYLVTRRRGSFTAGLALSLLSGLMGIVLGFALEYVEAKVGLLVAMAAGVTVMLQSIMGGITTMMDAVRPLRLGLLLLIYRLLYSLLIILALYVEVPSLLHVFIATSISISIATALGFRWLYEALGRKAIEPPWSTLNEWARTSRPLIIAYVTGFVASLDATIAYPLAGPNVVAAFFIAAAIATLVRESSNTGLRYLHTYVLTTSDVAGGLRSTFLVAMLAAPLLIYAAVHPLYIIYVFNYKYSWASMALTIFMITAIIEIVNGGLSNVVMGSISEVGEESLPKFERLNIMASVPSLIYVVMLAAALAVLKGEAVAVLITAWSLVYMARFMISVTIYYSKFVSGYGKSVIRSYAGKLLAYAALAVLLSLLFKPLEPPSKGLLRSIYVLAEMGIPYLAAYYGIIVLIDKGLRATAARLLKSSLRRWG
ncbi:hypothetical protein [Acidilobus sp.]|uniref:hypothetical protein n=1 Tax=Acidilobus sp. TaxID=1872109 RepID=UPI003D00AF27